MVHHPAGIGMGRRKENRRETTKVLGLLALDFIEMEKKLRRIAAEPRHHISRFIKDDFRDSRASRHKSTTYVDTPTRHGTTVIAAKVPSVAITVPRF
jgi:hypothetical protein